MYRNVIVRTSAGDINFEASGLLTLEEFLRSKRLPSNLFQGYEKTGVIEKPVSLHICINEIPQNSEVVLRCIRNTDLKDVLPQKTFYKKTDNSVTALSTFELGSDGCIQTITELNSEQAREIVGRKVNDFLKKHSRSQKVVVGISGGGDSNTLAEAIKNFSLSKKNDMEFVFFTIVFEPLWPQSAADRASGLCAKYKVRHEVYGPEKIQSLLGMKAGIDKCYVDFCKEFGHNTGHFFGTYLISAVARKLCRVHNAQEYVLGFNREDLLAELLFSLMNGQKPLAFPVRTFDDIKLLMPVWDVPKLMLDACYPKLSLENYSERENNSTFQRSIIYYLAHGIEDMYDNLGLTLMHGVQKLFENNWAQLSRNEDVDLYVSPYAKEEKIKNVQDFFRRYFSA